MGVRCGISVGSQLIRGNTKAAFWLGLPPIIMLIYINYINYGASPNKAECYLCNYSIWYLVVVGDSAGGPLFHILKKIKKKNSQWLVVWREQEHCTITHVHHIYYRGSSRLKATILSQSPVNVNP